MVAPPPPTLLEKLSLLPITLRSVFNAIVQLVIHPIRSGPKPSLLKDVVFTAIRSQLPALNSSQEAWLNAPTESVYLDLAKKEGFQPDSIVLSDGSKAHWLGPKTGEKVVVFFHGGGYCLPCSTWHMQWIFDLNQALSKSTSFSALALGYTIAPNATYPTQLRQATELLSTLTTTLNKPPSDIIICGDSAGGNLALALLSHILHPHPSVPPLNLSTPLLATILISPWIDFSPAQPSFQRNRTTDYITAALGARWSATFLGGAARDTYNEPIHADAAWFAGLERATKDLLVWGGGGEALVDSIDGIARTLGEAFPRTEYVREVGAAHEEMLTQQMLGYRAEGVEGTRVIRSWIAARL